MGAVRAALALLDPEEEIQSLRAESRQSLRQRGVEARKIDIAEAPQRRRNAVRMPPAPPPPLTHISPPLAALFPSIQRCVSPCGFLPLSGFLFLCFQR